MLVLLLHIGGQRYCIRTSCIAEVIPRVPADNGLLHYRGDVIPLIDLKQLLVAQPSSDVLSTRIIIVESNGTRAGLVAERLTETLTIDERALTAPPASSRHAPFLGGVVLHGDAMVRELVVERLLEAAA
jgi:chemotaxis-related protein WspB